MKREQIKKMTLSAMFLAVAFVLPFFTGQIPQIGQMLCPMHIPVLLCGFLCGGNWGALVGFVAPILRSALMTMPPMFPTAICMAVELATYGITAGFLYRTLPKRKWAVYAALISAMVIGRVIWGIAMFACLGFDSTQFGLQTFLAGAITTAIPGIVLQIVLIPIIVFTMEKVVKK